MTRIICLASSRFDSGRCIAGKDKENGKWIRPVNDVTGEGLSYTECAYGDNRHGENSIPKTLDIIDVPLREPYPCKHQTENWLIGGGGFHKCGVRPWKALGELADKPLDLWGESSKVSINDIKGNYIFNLTV